MKPLQKKNFIFLIIGIFLLFFISKCILAVDDEMAISAGGDEESLFLVNFADNETAITTQISGTISLPPTTPPVTPPAPSTGPAASIVLKGFVLDKSEIKVKLKQGTFLTEQITITNLEANEVNFVLNVSKVDNFVKLSEYAFTLKPKEIKVISVDILAREDAVPDLYIGEIMIKGAGVQKNVLTAIEISSANPLFDISLKIPSQYSYVLPGKELLAEIQLYNLGEKQEVDISVEYIILDSEGKEILTRTEEIAVNTQISFIRSFQIPDTAPYGRYILYIRTTYNDKLASASALFNVGEAPAFPWIWIVTITLLLLSIVITILIIRIKKNKKPVKKISEKLLRRANIIKKR